MNRNIYILLGIAFIALTLFLGNWGLTESSEARYAEISKEMFLSNDYLNPTLLGIKHLHKPPITYYLTALSYKIFGVNEFAARFLMQLALVFQLFLVYKIALFLYENEKIALAASLIYFSFPLTVISVRTLTTDAYLTTFILASIYFWLCYKKQPKSYLLYLFYIFLGLIFETKGPVGLIVPLTFVASYKIVNKDKIEISIHQLLGLLSFLIISASWYIAVVINNEGLLDYFLKEQLVERVSQDKFKRSKPFWYYVMLMPVLGLPWLFYLPFYFKKNISAILKQKSTAFILLTTFAVLFLILSISTSKLILYVLPLFFILAIFVAKYLSESKERVIKNISIMFISLILLITGTAILLSFVDAGIKVNLLYAVLVCSIFSSLALLFYKNIPNSNYLKPAYLSVIFIISIIMTTNHVFNVNESKINSVKPIASFIDGQSSTEYNVLIYNYLLPSLPFYLNREVTTINHGRYTTQREVQFEQNDKWKKNLINYSEKEDRQRLMNYDFDKPLYLVKRKRDKFPDTLLMLQKKLIHKKEFEKFEVYY